MPQPPEGGFAFPVAATFPKGRRAQSPGLPFLAKSRFKNLTRPAFGGEVRRLRRRFIAKHPRRGEIQSARDQRFQRPALERRRGEHHPHHPKTEVVPDVVRVIAAAGRNAGAPTTAEPGAAAQNTGNTRYRSRWVCYSIFTLFIVFAVIIILTPFPDIPNHII